MVTVTLYPPDTDALRETADLRDWRSFLFRAACANAAVLAAVAALLFADARRQHSA